MGWILLLIIVVIIFLLFSKKNEPQKIKKYSSGNTHEHGEGASYTTRLGKSVKTDKIFDAWTSGDLKKMLKVVNLQTNPIDRHFLLQNIVSETYKDRKNNSSRELCKKYASLYLEEFENIAPALKKDMGELPKITTFQNYATVLTEDKEYDKAIEVCKKAIQYNLHDGTKSGYEGRIERIKKKANKTTA